MTPHRTLIYLGLAILCLTPVVTAESPSQAVPNATEEHVILAPLSPQDARADLTVSKNGRYLVHSDGTPFYWLGDTAWGLFQKLDRGDVEHYFEIRACQRFSVIHAAVYNVNPFILPPLSNVYGDMPFINDDPTKPDITPGSDPANAEEYDYWDHVEYVIDVAADKGLYINLLPIFGVAKGDGYNFLTPENALQYGKFIGNRFKNKTNVIWCMGGDVLADNNTRKAVWNLLAKGVTIGVAGSEDYQRTLMTYHPRGGASSAPFYHNAPWLDFNMLQTWSAYTRIQSAVTMDYNRRPVKPILHGEGAYEGGPEYPTKPITPHVIRKQAYWACFSGGFHTYGNSNVWNFGTTPYYVSQDWKKALKSPGASHLAISRNFMESVQWWELVPDQSVLAAGANTGDTLNVAMRSDDNSRVVVYLSCVATVSINLGKIVPAATSTASWVDPKTGDRSKIGVLRNEGVKSFSTPDGWEDALLVLE